MARRKTEDLAQGSLWSVSYELSLSPDEAVGTSNLILEGPVSGVGTEVDEMEDLMSDPRFQNLLGKAESHQWKFRPKESELLDSTGALLPMLQRRTKECWDLLSLSRKSGMSLMEAQEVAYPKILVPSETN